MRKRLLVVGAVLLLAILACKGGEPPQPQVTATPTPWIPHVGGQVFGVECQPVTGLILHGELAEVVISDIGGVGRIVDFQIGSIRSAGDSDASEVSVSARPQANDDGWSQLPGVVLVDSQAVDGPPRTVTYYVNILLGAIENGNHVVGGNLWCQVDVLHEEVIPTVVVTPYFMVTYTGPVQVRQGSVLEASFEMTAADGTPASGSFLATLGDPPSDPRATHAGGELSSGEITLSLLVNWPVGTTKLYFSYDGEVYEMTEIEITE